MNLTAIKKNHFTKITPLTIVALFLSLSEAVAGFAAIHLEGTRQMLAITFVIFFPIAIAAAFFVILWNRPYVYYTPTEYADGVSVTQFVEAMQQRQMSDSKVITQIEEKIREIITSKHTLSELEGLVVSEKSNKASTATNFLGGLAEKAIGIIRENFINVQVGKEFGKKAGSYKISYSPDEPISNLANSVHLLLSPLVPAYSFGKVWSVVDSSTGERFISAEREIMQLQERWKKGEFTDDQLTPKQIGVSPGVTIRPILL